MKNSPLHKEKEHIVRQYAQNFRCDTLIETGTHTGLMIYAVREYFKKVISIELSNYLAIRAKKAFSLFENVTIIEGDSGTVLRDILKNINHPCLFWLDAHYSAGCTVRGKKITPVLEELNCIFNHPIRNHVILIDDARCFNGNNDYPTIKELKDLVKRKRPGWNFTITRDIIRIHNLCKI